MGRISTHVLDVARGRPGAGIEVTLVRYDEDGGSESHARRPTPTAARMQRWPKETQCARRARDPLRGRRLLRRRGLPRHRSGALPRRRSGRALPRAAPVLALGVLDLPGQLTAVGAERVLARCDALAACTEEPGRITRRFATPALAEASELVLGWMRRGRHARPPRHRAERRRPLRGREPRARLR